ncbi:FACT complex subunit SPT16-like [Andrographis paniculata]|uniref:FACT complex subunit SPT16-like n=1 Tax=Andrographis paniculata TaxID=175694 RepID=UPI0021E8E180|nr:FACT complex subunit SPT16-like [Andrographis paniculata]XP_051119204.1 FACT complex subunit SPT16-like [Andrographis paniculata]XP_051119205.1 FACT complex subunit SPT16-like [Andrographis paniculata]XP_051119206.1 FACT complex subunit SPT16-like [Andrographis paniculata]
MPEKPNTNGASANANASSGNAYAIDVNTFSKRLEALYAHWRKHKDEFWGSADVLAVATPPPSEDLRYLKSSALNIWLLGYEFPETIMVFGDKHIHFLCSPKKAELLKVVIKPAKSTVNADVVMHVKAKGESGSSQMDSLLASIRSLSNHTPAVGHIAREDPEGKLLQIWSNKLKESGLKLSDISVGLSELFAVKDMNEIKCIKKAAYLTACTMKNFVVPKVEKVIDEEKKVSHAALMDDTEKAILEPLKIGVSLKAENVDICYPPIFQSGGNFDLRPSASSNDDFLYYDSNSIIVCAIGSRYNSYCSNVARTYLIDSHSVQSKAYEVLLSAQEAAINAIKPGNKVSAVYVAALAVVERDAPELVANLTKSAGTGIGLEFRESRLNLNAKNEKVIKVGMVFNVSLGFQNLQAKTKNPKSQKFSLLLADTVIVTETGRTNATAACSKALKDVAYSFNEGDEEEVPPKSKPEVVKESVYTKATLRSDNGELSKEELRRQHQAELARQKNEETARRLAGVGTGSGDGRAAVKAANELVAYKNVNDLPAPKDMMIQVDQKNEAILLPIYGCMVPFHVSTVKTVSSQQDTNRNCYVRIIFNVPGTPFTPHDANSLKNHGAIYLKEVSFRSKDPRHISEVVQLIKTLRRNVMARESERAERATLVTQEKLVLAGNKFKPIRLHDLWIRPTFGGRARKLSGTLEAHANGFRYSTSRADEKVDIMFGNVKHAFFQPAEKEMITLVHFHLHNHIMVGNKKTKDVQFYVEVMEMVQAIGGGKRSAYDPDEIEEEQRERDRKNKINMEFQQFVNRVNDLWGHSQFKGLDLEFDQPLRELGFHGVPYKASSFIIPTSSCLVELVETPFLVITLSEIEIVNLERVGLGQKNFDMAIVFKDFKRDVMRIDSIPSSSLDGIKEWLDTTDIKYYESRLNLNWRPILKTITDDPQKFVDDGGWEFLNLEATDSDSDNSEESDQGYEPTDVEPESDSEDEDSDSESLVDSEDDEDEEDSEVESEEEKGKTWEELEREASNADREKGDESDSEDERRRRKVKAMGKSRAGPSGGAATKRPKFR